MNIEITDYRPHIGIQPRGDFDIVANFDFTIADAHIEVRGATLTRTRKCGLSVLPPKPIGPNRNGVRWDYASLLAADVLAAAKVAHEAASGPPHYRGGLQVAEISEAAWAGGASGRQ